MAMPACLTLFAVPPRERPIFLVAVLAVAALASLALSGGPARYAPPPALEPAEVVAVETVALGLRPGWGPDGTPSNTVAVSLPDDTESLAQYFAALHYDLAEVREGIREVPRAYVTQLPGSLDDLEDANAHKTLYLQAILPLVLRANAEAADQRRRLTALITRLENGEALDGYDARWIVRIAERYGLSAPSHEEVDLAALRKRVDIVPPSLTLAQSILESGWGTSRFAQEGNALFGQRTWMADAPGLAPEEASGFRVRAFRDLAASVRSYVHNLNVGPAYAEFRRMRAQQRAAGEEPDGYRLAAALHRYSEEGWAYTEKLRNLITQNNLRAYDHAGLRHTALAQHIDFDPAAEAIRFVYEAGG